MIRQMVRSAALFAAGLLLANVAWGQAAVLRQTSSMAAYVATEYFGGAEPRVVQVSAMDLDNDATTPQRRPYVQLALSGAAVTDGNVAEITFTLNGATFQQSASPTHLDQRATSCAEAAATIGDEIEAMVIEGGARGDTSVTYRVEVTDASADGDLAIGQALCFWVPDLSVTLATLDAEATPPVQGVSVTASAIKPTASTGTPFPSRISGVTDVDADMSGAVSGSEIGNAPNVDVRILEATPALTAGLGMGGTAYVVDLAKRLTIGRGGVRDPSAAGTDAPMGLLVGRLSVGVSQMDIWELDGSGLLPKDSVDGSLSGQIDLTVGGRFQSGDKLVVGSGPTALMGEIEGGMAEVSVQIETIAGMDIVYVPGGVDALKPGTFAAAGAHLFNDRRNRNGPFGMSTGELKYFGIEVEGYAYGVVRGNGTDRSFVRVTCEAAANCAIFADCTGADGMEYFEAAPPIPAGVTVAWSSDDIEGLIGDGWTAGRGRCDVFSNGELSVQHLVRSGGILVNSSAVVGRSLDLRADRARATIDMVVDNICASVEGHLGRAGDPDGPDDNAETLTDNISAHNATACRSAMAAVIPDNHDTNGVDADGTNSNGF